MCVWTSAIKHSITLHQHEMIVGRKKIETNKVDRCNKITLHKHEMIVGRKKIKLIKRRDIIK